MRSGRLATMSKNSEGKTDLSDAVLESAVLKDAKLDQADMSGSRAKNADMSGASMHEVDFSNADLRDANLMNAKLKGAVLTGADLSGADLKGANLAGADLRGAIMEGLDLSQTNVSGVELDEPREKVAPTMRNILKSHRVWFGPTARRVIAPIFRAPTSAIWISRGSNSARPIFPAQISQGPGWYGAR